MTLNTMYSDHLAVGHVRGGFRPLHLADMPAPRQAATAELLGVVKSFLGSRRETRAPTGGSALRQVLKVQRLEYAPKVDTPYVDFLADEIAEPVYVDQVVPALGHPPEDMKHF